MDISIDVEEIAKDAADEATKIAATETAAADEEAAKAAAIEADKRATEEAAKIAAEEAAKATAEATGSASAPGMAGAGANVEMGAAGDTVPAADDHSIPPDSPPAGESQGASSPQKGADILGTSGAGELIIPPAVTREEELDAEDDAADYRFLQSMSTGFKDLQSRYGKRLERLQRRALNAKKAEQEFLQRADERVQDINERQAQLAADREAFILEKAKFEAAQAKAAEKAAAIDKDLVQRKAALDSHEKDLAAREQALATKLQAKDDKIQMLIAKRTQELEDSHKVAIQAQAEEHAGKLKEAVEATGATEAAKVNLDAHVKELEEKLAASDKEISILKESA